MRSFVPPMRVMLAMLTLVSTTTAREAQAQWTPLRNSPPGFLDTCNLLTDGTAVCHQYNTNRWLRLSPDINGSYVNGTWSRLADMPDGIDTTAGCNPCTYAPLYFASAVLPDGRLLVIGGEYISLRVVRTNIGFIYDPTSDSWSSQLAEAFGSGRIGDAAGVVLPDGTYILADILSTNIEALDPVTLTFRRLNPPGKRDRNSEEGWNLLPDGTVLAVDAGLPGSFERYDAVANAWGHGGTTPVNLADCCGSFDNVGNSHELGPGVLRPDGTLIYFSANSLGQNAVYDTTTDAWSHTPLMDFPPVPGQTNHFAVADGPASLLPNGNVLVMASPVNNTNPFNVPSHFFEFDGTRLVQVPDTPNAFRFRAYQGRMLLLPSGEVLLTAFDQLATQDVMLYSNGGQPDDSWRPAITAAPDQVVAGTTYSISGTLFNGFSEGASYGDDAHASTNYPLVRITNRATGHVFYGRTHDHSRQGVVTVGSTEVVTTMFDAPSAMEDGPSDLSVVVNGVASPPVSINQQITLRNIDSSVTFDPISSTFVVSSNTAQCGKGFAGTFSFDAKLANIATTPLRSIVAEVKILSDGDRLQNADGGPGGIGSRLTVPKIGDYADGVLGPGESVNMSFTICLQAVQPFEFFVDVLAYTP